MECKGCSNNKYLLFNSQADKMNKQQQSSHTQLSDGKNSTCVVKNINNKAVSVNTVHNYKYIHLCVCNKINVLFFVVKGEEEGQEVVHHLSAGQTCSRQSIKTHSSCNTLY